ncbi:MAG: GNAT family N-acetyltransferase [Bdellovibrionaceae bacterium]|nr:GNAT family N-acetyltransferase [Pseudobdellovibrionaceae bacterium]
MRIQELSSETWNDFVSLMSTDSQCTECWCLNHREPAGCPTGSAAKEKMQEMTDKKKVGGLLAYQDKECIGWIAVDPLAELVGHDCQPSGKPNEWSIHCIFVRDGFRGQGVSTDLIRAAIDFAKANGASLISAFPIPSENRKRFPVNEAEFSGRFSTYSKMGFKPVGESSDFYQRMELD